MSPFTACVRASDVRICVRVWRHTRRYDDRGFQRAARGWSHVASSALSPLLVAALVSFLPSLALRVENSQPGSQTRESSGFRAATGSRGPRPRGRRAACSGRPARKPGLRGGQAGVPNPCFLRTLGRLRCICLSTARIGSPGLVSGSAAGREHPAATRVEAGGWDSFRGSGRGGRRRGRRPHALFTTQPPRIAGAALRSPCARGRATGELTLWVARAPAVQRAGTPAANCEKAFPPSGRALL